MEDILASIRKILNEEEAPGTAGDSSSAEPLELTEDMLVAAPAEPEPEPITAPAPVSAVPADPAEPARPEPVPPAAERSPPEEKGSEPGASALAEGLIAPATAAAAAALLGQLARTVAAERSAPVYRAGPSIEDVVREEIRPLLKDWMDAHLPALMERLVRAEIERVVSRSVG
ncbi:DUF2497 domain-containing protein [Roseomonas sp. SSH11]|uniref:DUF2497 domain-containing protein n=2 Tax=Pararoseomonas baculiformis TaxID=2820812 RepID=A0ABS4AAF9_9PROT|nr:DUF2497 domain-containing protein [Pararoseomonas baculiformis]